MKANWSLVLNVILLFGVVVSIARLLFLRNKDIKNSARMHDDNSAYTNNKYDNLNRDEIIAVRKVNDDERLTDLGIKLSPVAKNMTDEVSENHLENDKVDVKIENTKSVDSEKTLMLFLSAKDQREFFGYELLQSLLAVGLRFGEGNIFHKYQKNSGQGAVLFSLAAATATGTFDLQNMGSYSVRGLCLYMHLSGNRNIDSERFSLMYDIAKSLSEDLDAKLLDDKQKIFSEVSMARYSSHVNAVEEESL